MAPAKEKHDKWTDRQTDRGTMDIVILFSYTGQENPTGSVVLDFSVWYCLSGTHFRCVSFKLIYVPWVQEK